MAPVIMPAAIPARVNLAIAAGLVALHAAALGILPFLLPLSPLWGLVLVLPVLVTPTLWAMVHEAIHGSLHPDRALNDRLGRVLAGMFGAPFQLLRLGHLQHHRFNRSPLNRVEVAQGLPPTLAERAGYFGRLAGGLYLGEFLASALAILPERTYRWLIRLGFEAELADGRSMWPAARRQLLEEPGRSRMRSEGLAITLGLALVLWAFGAWWWMLALAILGRGLVVSFLDNAYHYGNRLDEVAEGSDLRLAGPLRLMFLNFNFHGTHHQRPNLPWTALPGAFRGLGRTFAGGLGGAALRQLAGPISERHLREAAEAGERRRPAETRRGDGGLPGGALGP